MGLEESIGGYLYSAGSHTIEQVIDLFGIPQRLVSSVRTLPEGNETFKAVVVCDDMFEDPKVDTIPVRVGTLRTKKGIPREDIASIICEYETMNVVIDFTGWEAHWWCQDWSLDIYGTNGTLHSLLQPSKVNLYLREARGGYEKGDSVLNNRTDGNTKECFARQMELFLKRAKLGKLEADKQGLQKCDIPRQIGIQKLLGAAFESAKSRTFVKV